MIRIHVFGINCRVEIQKAQIETESSTVRELQERNKLNISPLQNALGYVEIFKNSVPALISLMGGIVKAGEKKAEGILRLEEKKFLMAERKLEREKLITIPPVTLEPDIEVKK